MNTTTERLQRLRVADVMSREVVSVSANATMSEASRVLLEHGLSGAPVVNELGRCVGVLSLIDFARRDCSHDDESDFPKNEDEFVLQRDETSGALHIEHAVEGYVHQYMSKAVQSIDQDQPLIDAARYMHAEKIHRLIVLDDTARPLGVVSALDLIGVFAESVFE